MADSLRSKLLIISSYLSDNIHEHVSANVFAQRRESLLMIKMIIEMDEDKILAGKEPTLEQVYTTLDRIFSKRGMENNITERGIEYLCHENPTDFAYFGKIMLGLKEQAWFIDNAKTWLYCNSDDSEDPSDFNEEDLLVHYGIRVA